MGHIDRESKKVQHCSGRCAYYKFKISIGVHSSSRGKTSAAARQKKCCYPSSGPSYDKVVFSSIGDEVMKATVAKFHADELVTDSPRVLAIIREKMNTRAKNFNIVIDNVAMLHISFKDAFHKAVEGKMVEQQEVERSKLLIAKA
ncbi:hypothetical protein U1Q18_001647 [Sarracenia purpurea var. burkii]